MSNRIGLSNEEQDIGILLSAAGATLSFFSFIWEKSFTVAFTSMSAAGEPVMTNIWLGWFFFAIIALGVAMWYDGRNK